MAPHAASSASLEFPSGFGLRGPFVELLGAARYEAILAWLALSLAVVVLGELLNGCLVFASRTQLLQRFDSLVVDYLENVRIEFTIFANSCIGGWLGLGGGRSLLFVSLDAGVEGDGVGRDGENSQVKSESHLQIKS